jgi:hypothetical protein
MRFNIPFFPLLSSAPLVPDRRQERCYFENQLTNNFTLFFSRIFRDIEVLLPRLDQVKAELHFIHTELTKQRVFLRNILFKKNIKIEILENQL